MPPDLAGRRSQPRCRPWRRCRSRCSSRRASPWHDAAPACTERPGRAVAWWRLDDRPFVGRDRPPGRAPSGGSSVRASSCLLIVSFGLTGCYSYAPAVYQSRDPSSADLPSAPRHASIMATRHAGAAKWSSEDLEDLGGPVIPDATMIAIWWGQSSRFPSDAMSGMDTFLTGLDGSRYLAVVDQYVRQHGR